MKLKVILTGATGMVGEGVLHECLNHPDVEQVLTVSRRMVGTHHPKLKTIVHDFKDLSSIQEELKGYNACFFCLGMSSIGIKEEEFTDKTYHLTTRFAQAVASGNPDLTFCYISGSGTDSTEKGGVCGQE